GPLSLDRDEDRAKRMLRHLTDLHRRVVRQETREPPGLLDGRRVPVNGVPRGIPPVGGGKQRVQTASYPPSQVCLRQPSGDLACPLLGKAEQARDVGGREELLALLGQGGDHFTRLGPLRHARSVTQTLR